MNEGKRKKVLMAVAIYYTSPAQVGSQHYARAFERKGYEVLYISFPISPLHKIFLNNAEVKERERIWKVGGERKGNIIYYVPFAILTPHKKPILSSKFIVENWYRLTIPNLFGYIKKKGFDKVDILWFDHPAFFFLLDFIDYGKAILRISDYDDDFLAPELVKKKMEIARRADLVIYTAKNLKDKYQVDEEKMLYVPNGIDLELFEKADKSFPDEFKNIPEPRVIYVGAMHEWFDVELLYYCAEKLQDMSFVLIGPVRKDISKLKNSGTSTF